MKISLLLLLCLGAAGCSSVSVHEETAVAALAPASRPVALYVRPFSVPRGVEFDAAAKSGEDDPQARVGRLVADGVLSRAKQLIAPGKLLEPGALPPASGLLVEGKVLRVRQGSRALRLGIGFGFGRSRMETSVKVFNLDRSAAAPWLAFETTGGSNSEPGLVGVVVPSPVSIPVAMSVIGGTAAAGAITGKGVTDDAKRTGRTIAAAIHERLADAGLVKRKTSAKKPGKIETPAGPVSLPPTE